MDFDIISINVKMSAKTESFHLFFLPYLDTKIVKIFEILPRVR